MDSKIIFIHGGEDVCTGQHHWFPYAVKRFNEAGYKTCNPDFPDPIHPKKDVWMSFLDNTCKPDENSIIIGHSYGAITALRYAQEHKLLGIVLVGAFYTNIDEDWLPQSGFTAESWDWDAIKKNTDWRIQFHSTDDPSVPFREGKKVSELIDSEFYTFTNAMHFGIDGVNPYPEFPELVDTVLEKLKS